MVSTCIEVSAGISLDVEINRGGVRARQVFAQAMLCIEKGKTQDTGIGAENVPGTIKGL